MQTEVHRVVGNLVGERYLLERRAAVHGEVELYEALDTQLDRPVSLQILTERGAQDPSLAREFLTHQRIASTMYDCALAVYDGGEWQGRPFSVMEKGSGVSPASLYRPHPAPDVAAALRITRQTAQALQCCRDAGLAGWTFTPDAVCVDADGNARLAILEGLSGEASSSRSAEDPAALGGLLKLMLAGRAGTASALLESAGIPAPVVSLLARLEGTGRGAGITNAGQLAAAVATLEGAALQPTQAYSVIAPTARVEKKPAAVRVAPARKSMPPPVSVASSRVLTSGPHDTRRAGIAAAVAAYESAQLPQETPGSGLIPGNSAPRRPLYRSLIAAGVSLLLVALLVALWPKTSGATAQVEGTQTGDLAKRAVGNVVVQTAAPTATNAPAPTSTLPPAAPIVQAPPEPTPTETPVPPSPTEVPLTPTPEPEVVPIIEPEPEPQPEEEAPPPVEEDGEDDEDKKGKKNKRGRGNDD